MPFLKIFVTGDHGFDLTGHRRANGGRVDVGRQSGHYPEFASHSFARQ